MTWDYTRETFNTIGLPPEYLLVLAVLAVLSVVVVSLLTPKIVDIQSEQQPRSD